MCEVVEKDRTIASVASWYDLVAQTTGNWVARYRKDHAADQDRKDASESAEIAKLRAENRAPRQENELREKSSRLLREGTSVIERLRARGREEGHYPIASMCTWATYLTVGLLLLVRPITVRRRHQKRKSGHHGQGRF